MTPVKYVKIRGSNFEAPRWILYISYALISSGLVLIVLIVLGATGGHPVWIFIIGGVEVALGTGIAVKVIRRCR
jgi:hypothetical protein